MPRLNINGDVEDVLVRKIKTQEDNQFSPKDYKDFNANVLYSVKTAMNDKEQKEQKYYAWIGRLAGSVEELNDTNNKRISWSAWPSDVLDEPNNISQDEKQQVVASSSIVAHRERTKQRKSNKRAATEEYEKFLYNNSMEKISEHGISDSEQITDSSGHAVKRCSQNQEQLSVNYNQSEQTVSVPLGELSNLHEKVVQKIEEKMEEKMEKSSKMMEEKFIEIVKEQLSQAYEKLYSKWRK